MKRKLTVLGLIFLLSFSARAYQAAIDTDIHNRGVYTFYVDSAYSTAFGNNLVFYQVLYALEDNILGYALVFYDLAFSTVKIIGFGYDGGILDNLMIEASWPDLTRSVTGVATYQDRLSSVTLSIETKNVQGSDRPAPARTERSGDGMLLPDHDLKSVIPEKSGLQSLEYDYLLKGEIPGSLVTYYYYVYDELSYSPEAGFYCYSLIAELHYLGMPWKTADGLLFIRPWNLGPDTYYAAYLTTFQNSELKSMSLTEQIFRSGNNPGLIAPEGTYGNMTLTLEYP